MIPIKKIRQLDITPTVKTRPSYVYAASGLVRIGERLYIVADDELHLAVFEYGKDAPGTWVRLMAGTLPDDYQERKKAKPDLEGIAFLSPYEHAEHGALLVVPSMSRKKRVNGMLLLLDDKQQLSETALPIDFSPLREKLESMVIELNVEGIVALPNVVKLFHRGSKQKSKSAVIDLDPKAFFNDLHDSHVLRADQVLNVKEFDLGAIEDVPLNFTDATLLPDKRMLFLATAENAANAYDDGPSRGSAVGIMSQDGKVERIVNIEGREKLEGVSATISGDQIELLLVSDTDDQTIAAGLFEARLPV